MLAVTMAAFAYLSVGTPATSGLIRTRSILIRDARVPIQCYDSIKRWLQRFEFGRRHTVLSGGGCELSAADVVLIASMELHLLPSYWQSASMMA